MAQTPLLSEQIVMMSRARPRNDAHPEMMPILKGVGSRALSVSAPDPQTLTHSSRSLLPLMVYAVLLPQGLNEKGGGKALRNEIMFQSMVRECCEPRNVANGNYDAWNIVTIAYCDDGNPSDGWNHHSLDTTGKPIDLKALRDLVKRSLPDRTIKMAKFSFASDDASQLLSLADVFYFKGFGGGYSNLLPTFQKPFPSIVQEFQNRVTLNWPRPLMTIHVCGGAILMGSKCLDIPQLACMELFGPASLRYFSCELMTQEKLQSRALDPYDIPLAPGVGILVQLTPGRAHSVRCVNIACTRKYQYESFRLASFNHIDRVFASVSRLWRTYYYADELGNTKWWALRPDGTAVVGCLHVQSLLEAIRSDHPGESIQWWW